MIPYHYYIKEMCFLSEFCWSVPPIFLLSFPFPFVSSSFLYKKKNKINIFSGQLTFVIHCGIQNRLFLQTILLFVSFHHLFLLYFYDWLLTFANDTIQIFFLIISFLYQSLDNVASDHVRFENMHMLTSLYYIPG